MFPEIGNFALILALGLALIQVVLGLRPATQHHALTVNLTRSQTFFVSISFVALVYAFISNDFSISYVAQNSNRDLPLTYRVCATWGSHEGSMLLWILILNLWSLAVASMRSRQALPAHIHSTVLTVLSAINLGLLCFTIATSNPFWRLLPNVPGNGQDLNPLLQDIGFVLHPPMLYMGYVGFCGDFCFCCDGSLLWRT